MSRNKQLKPKLTVGRIIKRVIISLLIIAGLVAVTLGSFIVAAIITNYEPDERILLDVQGSAKEAYVSPDNEYKVVTFNIGYCGLDKSQDFFMDGGKGSGASSKEEVLANLIGVENYLKDAGADFYFIQEVDEKGKRSFNVDQLDRLASVFGDFSYAFALNYKVLFVPLPITNPMGGVQSGILTLSGVLPKSAARHRLAGEESYIWQLFELDRCFTVTRLDIDMGEKEGEKELVLINAHFSAYDEGGKIREKQLKEIRQVLEEEYAAGNYVILGGDWNHLLPNTDPNNFKWEGEYPSWCVKLPDDFNIAGYNWAVDGSAPTCRDNREPYIAGRNFVVNIDGFLVSDNIEMVSAVTNDLNFEYSDHNPVELTFKLKKDNT